MGSTRKRLASFSVSSPKQKSARMSDWDPERKDAFFSHAGGIYSEMIKIPEVARKFITNPIYARMNRIEQLSCADSVYRQAKQSRFEHSLGVLHLVSKVMQHLRKLDNSITGNDELCVCILALSHDLGHGPFSHVFEDVVKESELARDYKHETQSVKVFDYILETFPAAKAALDTHLSEDDYTFIREAINPPPFPADEKDWTLKGRGPKKAFMYEIVANAASGFDFDKMDYILRDSHHTGVAISIDQKWVFRIIEAMSLYVENGIKRCQFDEKVHPDLHLLYKSRQTLYSAVYYHKTLYPIQRELKRAILYAAPHLQYRGTFGNVNLFNALNDMKAFVRLTDGLFDQIKTSTDEHEDMERARKCLENIECKHLDKSIVIFKKIPFKVDPNYFAGLITNLRGNFKKVRDFEAYMMSDKFYLVKENYMKGLFKSFISENPEFNNDRFTCVIKRFDHGKCLDYNPVDMIPIKNQTSRLGKSSNLDGINIHYSLFVYGNYFTTTREARNFSDRFIAYMEQKNFPAKATYTFKGR